MEEKLLLVIGKYFPYDDASSNCMDVLRKELKTKKINFDVLTVKWDETSDILEKKDDVNIYRIPIIKPQTIQDIKKSEKLILIKIYYILIILFKKIYFKFFKQKPSNEEGMKEETIDNISKKIVELDNINKYDYVVSVSYPFGTNIACLKAKPSIKGKWFSYMLDPYTTNFTLSKQKRLERRKIEETVLEKVDKVFCSDELVKDYYQIGFEKYINKLIAMPFPNIRKLNEEDINDSIKFDKNYINCVFAGFLYPDIRNPKCVLDMFSKLDNPKIIFHVVGSTYGDFEKGFFEKYKEKMKECLIFHGIKSQKASTNAILNADILVNVGNSIANQMPSKIFDYISTGNPIINFYKNENCPTLKYTNNYPICLNINENHIIRNEDIHKFETFCEENKNNQIKFSEIEELYSFATSKQVAERFYKEIKL